MIAYTPRLASFLLMTCTPTVASSMLTDKHPFLNFLLLLSLYLSPILTVEVTMSLNNCSSFVYLPPIRSSSTKSRIESISPFILSSSRNLFLLEDFNCRHFLWVSKGTFDPRREEVFSWVISSNLLPLNDLDTSSLFHRSSGSRSSFVIFFASSSLAPGKCSRTWILINSQFS